MPTSVVISVLARSLLAGEAVVSDVQARAARTLGRSWRWIGPLAERYVSAFASRPRPRHRDAVRFLLDDAGVQRALDRHRHELSVAQWIVEPQRMQPVPAARLWGLPRIECAGDLADWLALTPGELDWFADLKGLGYKVGGAALQHYHYRILMKRSGGVRLIESPKARLKYLQRRILNGILDLVPVHTAVHGFVTGRSIVSFATPHTGADLVLRLDLEDFFPGFPGARVQALFRTFGYPESVADLLGGICTNAVPRSVWGQRPPDSDYARPHLPQGAPTSPALANLMAYRLDCRLSGLARSAGGVYTRYADDLAFSGGAGFARAAGRFSARAAAVALEEGFSVNHRKTRFMRQGVRQCLAGVVVNQRAGVPRRELELLEAILYNCVRSGPAGQNPGGHADFRAHLAGRVGFVEMIDLAKGRRLRALLDAIDWAHGPDAG